jgi:hypothetical protein
LDRRSRQAGTRGTQAHARRQAPGTTQAAALRNKPAGRDEEHTGCASRPATARAHCGTRTRTCGPAAYNAHASPGERARTRAHLPYAVYTVVSSSSWVSPSPTRMTSPLNRSWRSLNLAHALCAAKIRLVSMCACVCVRARQHQSAGDLGTHLASPSHGSSLSAGVAPAVVGGGGRCSRAGSQPQVS